MSGLKALSGIDTAIMVAYCVGIVALGCWAGLRHRRASTSQGYFMAGHELRWPSIGLALFATNISCFHLVSLAQAGYDEGLLMGNFEWMAAYTLILLGLFFAPFYIRSRVATLPDFLEKRYCRQCRDWLAVISMVAAVIFHISFPLSTGWVVMHGIFGIEKWTCIIAMCALTAVYTVVGGLAAVVMTEMVQAIVLIIGALLITYFAYDKVGGWDQMVHALQSTGDAGKLTMLRPHSVEKVLPWYAVFLGYPVIGIWYWCTDQTIVQRVLGARDENHARTGPLFCGLIKVLPVFIFVLPGLMFYAILSQGRLPGVRVENSKEVYGVMIRSLLPTGVLGVMAASLMAALMGNLASAANSISTLFSYDLLKRFRPSTGERALLLSGRIASFLAFVVGIALVPALDRYESVFAAAQDIISHIAPPITTVFLVGIFWPRASAAGARWTMWIGSAAGALIFTLKTLHTGWPGTFGWVPAFVTETPFMMMAFYLFLFCLAVQVGFTLARPKQPHEDPERLYWEHPFDALRTPGWPGLGDYRVLSGLLFVTMTALYVVFR